MLLINKLALKVMPLPSLLSDLQFVAAVLFVLLLKAFGVAEPDLSCTRVVHVQDAPSLPQRPLSGCGLSGRCCLGCGLACARPVCPFQLNSCEDNWCEAKLVTRDGPLLSSSRRASRDIARQSLARQSQDINDQIRY